MIIDLNVAVSAAHLLPNSGELPFDISKHPACRHAEKSLSRWSEERAGITSKTVHRGSRFEVFYESGWLKSVNC